MTIDVKTRPLPEQEIWANAHETRHSISIISYAGCLVDLQQFQRKFTRSVNAVAQNTEKFSKTPILGVQGPSRSSMLVTLESSSAVLVMISSKSVSICNHYRARLADSSRNRTFSRGDQHCMRSYGCLVEPRGSNLTALKSTFSAEHFIRRLSWSILNRFGAIHS